jgi:nucleotide-binding universal stress UspA family protein
MYARILVALENSAADRVIIDHVRRLASVTGSRLLLVHVADGWVARNYDRFSLRESDEMRTDRDYLERVAAELSRAGFAVEWRLALGDPAQELVRAAEAEDVDLVAMATHGHRLLADVLYGATADRVRHALRVPVLLVRA